MNYEQKYKFAIEQAKKELEACGSMDCDAARQIFRLFPELAESKDERIKKEIIRYLDRKIISSNFGGDIATFKGWIDWLKKQGEQKPIWSEENNCYYDDICEILISLINSPKSNVNKDAVQKDLNWLMSIKELQSKPTRSEESKFKVGDWIVQKGLGIYKIIEVCASWYEVISYNDGNQYSISFDMEKDCHLWTIQDAKKGDILQANKCTLIFDSLTKDIDGNTAISSWYYCDTKTFYGMGTCKPDLWVIDGVVPATKEQRNLLFQKMKEAGYKWNIKEKKLIKL